MKPMAAEVDAKRQTLTRMEHRAGTILALSFLAADHMPCGDDEKKQ